MNRRDLLKSGLAAMSVPTLSPLSALAQAKYPERPIKLMIAFSAGGVNDVVGRHWAERMKPLLGTVSVGTRVAPAARPALRKSPAPRPTAIR
jgi:tripartite-type tricarboxylate transporter receptor subunit TctC